MIKFIDNAFIGGQTFTAGMMGYFDTATESQLVANGDAVPFPVVVQPVEVLAMSSQPIACSTTGADEALASFTIPAGLMGVNSSLQIEPVWTHANSATNKILKVKIGVTAVYSVTRTTSAREGPLIVLSNRNSLSSQIQPYDSAYLTAGATNPATYTIDFSKTQIIQITGNRAITEALTLEYFRILHFVGS